MVELLVHIASQRIHRAIVVFNSTSAASEACASRQMLVNSITIGLAPAYSHKTGCDKRHFALELVYPCKLEEHMDSLQ